jgi:hypothetical protein
MLCGASPRQVIAYVRAQKRKPRFVRGFNIPEIVYFSDSL